MATYFDLLTAHSYKITGLSSRRYAFYKGKPVYVTDEQDASKFRAYPELFYECDEEGNAVINDSDKKAARTIVTFRPHIANRDEVIEKSAIEAEAKRKAGVNVGALLEEVQKDITDKNPSDEDKKDNTDGAPSVPVTANTDADKTEIVGGSGVKKQKKAKVEKDPLVCELCGYKAKDLEDLKAHIDQHDEED